MSQNHYAKIAYGIPLQEEGQEENFSFFKEFETDIRKFWNKELGFKRSKELFTSNGNYLSKPKPTEEELKKYFKEQDDFEEQNPLSAQLENCSYTEYPNYILVIPSSVISIERGEGLFFNPSDLKVSQEDIEKFENFISKYCEGLDCKSHGWILFDTGD